MHKSFEPGEAKNTVEFLEVIRMLWVASSKIVFSAAMDKVRLLLLAYQEASH